MPYSEGCGMAANEKMREHRLGFILSALASAKCLAGSKGSLEPKIQPQKTARIFIECLTIAPSRRRFGEGHCAYGQLVRRTAFVQGL